MRNWLEMTPADFGYTADRPRPTLSRTDVKSLQTYARKLRREAQKAGAR